MYSNQSNDSNKKQATPAIAPKTVKAYRSIKISLALRTSPLTGGLTDRLIWSKFYSSFYGCNKLRD